jgi:hypothetical protein
MLGCAISAAHAGTRRVYADGGSAVEQCEDGSYTVTDSHGHKRVFAQPNAGFERHPGQPQSPVYDRREHHKKIWCTLVLPSSAVSRNILRN